MGLDYIAPHSLAFLRTTYIFLSCFLSLSISAQEYESVIVPFDVNPNAPHMIFDGSRFVILSLNRIDDGIGCTLVEVNENLEKTNEFEFKDILFSRFSPQQIGNKFYGYAADNTVDNRYMLIELNEELDISSIDTFAYFSDDGGVVTMHVQNGHIYGGIVDREEGTSPSTNMNIKKFSAADKTELFSINLGEEETYFFSTNINQIEDDLLVSGNIFRNAASFAGIYKLTPDGDIVWKFVSTANQSRGNVPVLTAVLSNGNIVYTDKVERQELWPQNYNEKPARIGWLTPEGDSLREHIMLVPRNNLVELEGIKSGLNGDYFYFYGSRSTNDVGYGILTKMSNDGEIIWSRKYQDPQSLGGQHKIRDIEELPNGDIVTLGRVSVVTNDPGTEIWMMRLNEHGCFGTETCSDEPIYTATSDIEVELRAVLLYPNPTGGTLYIAEQYASDISSYSIHTTEGRLIIKDSPTAYGKIDVSALETGIYMITLTDKNGELYTEQIVKE